MVTTIAWRAAAIAFAANWLYNAAPGKWQAAWYSHVFAQRVGYFTQGNPIGPVHHLLSSVVLAHPATSAAVSAAGETAAALLLLFTPTVRLGGIVAAMVATTYALGSSWVNVGYAAHNGSFALLGVLFAVVGPTLRPHRPMSIAAAAVAGTLGAALTWSLGHSWEGWWPAEPWALASLALLVAAVSGALTKSPEMQGHPRAPIGGHEGLARARLPGLDGRSVTVYAALPVAAVAALLDAVLLRTQWSSVGHPRTAAYLAATTVTFVLAPAAAGLHTRPLVRASLFALGAGACTAVAVRVVPYRSVPVLCLALVLTIALDRLLARGRPALSHRATIVISGALGVVPLLLL